MTEEQQTPADDNPEHGTPENPVTTDYNTENLPEVTEEDEPVKDVISEDFNVPSSEEKNADANPEPVDATAEGADAPAETPNPRWGGMP